MIAKILRVREVLPKNNARRSIDDLACHGLTVLHHHANEIDATIRRRDLLATGREILYAKGRTTLAHGVDAIGVATEMILDVDDDTLLLACIGECELIRNVLQCELDGVGVVARGIEVEHGRGRLGIVDTCHFLPIAGTV